MPAHVKSVMLGPSLELPGNGANWPAVGLCEHRDHVHSRRITASIVCPDAPVQVGIAQEIDVPLTGKMTELDDLIKQDTDIAEQIARVTAGCLLLSVDEDRSVTLFSASGEERSALECTSQGSGAFHAVLLRKSVVLPICNGRFADEERKVYVVLDATNAVGSKPSSLKKAKVQYALLGEAAN
eukprot:GHVU01074295.1.p1 GENE.GHVU01074295.1~~GHVU01074295.1.p1  ORF type:complete len:183 (-),score=19.86 GHVU01074295.1:390-938(-)